MRDMCRVMVWAVLLCMASTLPGQDRFEDVGRDYVPEGKPKRQARISTVQQCQAACATKASCKAYAFYTSKPACYFYQEVFMGGTPLSRKMGMYSAGLSIVPRTGFVSAFKHGSFPAPPVFDKRQ